MAIQFFGNGGSIVTGQKDIGNARLITMRVGMRLEAKGIKMSKGRSLLAQVKDEFGLKGSRQTVYAAFSKLVEQRTGVPETIGLRGS